MSANDSGQRKTSSIKEIESTSSTSLRSINKNAKETTTKTMVETNQQKPDLQKLINLVHSSDIQAGSESASALREMLLNGDSNLLCNLLSQYVLSNSEKLVEIIAAVRQPLDKVLLDQLTEMWSIHPQACLSLVNQLILQQVPWLYKFPQHPSFLRFIKAMKSNGDDVPYCVGVSLILASLILLTAPLISPNLSEIFNAFLFLVGILHKKTPTTSETEVQIIHISLLHFRLALFALFQRSYGLFPCHFLTFLRQNFAGPQTTSDNRILYKEIIQPMLDFVKLHPLLVTTNKEGELAKERWVRKEVHDILAECNRISADPSENNNIHDDTSYFRRGLARPASNSNFLTWGNSTTMSRPSSSSWISGKPTPVKDASTTSMLNVTPKTQSFLGLGGGAENEERRPRFSSIILPSATSSSNSTTSVLQKSTTASTSQQQASYWSPSDAVGLSTPPEEDEDGSIIPELRLKSRTMIGQGERERRKTSMAAGPESPAPHMRSFRTGSWGADARQKFLQTRQQKQQQQQQQLLKNQQQQESANSLFENDRKSSTTRRGLGQAFAKLFNRPSAGSSSTPQSPSIRRPASDREFDFDFEPTEIRPTKSNSIVLRRNREAANLSEQAELAEEADEACSSSAAGSAAASRNGNGSLTNSKRPSLSEPVLFPLQQKQALLAAAAVAMAADEGVNKELPENAASGAAGESLSIRKLNTMLKTLAKENDENLLEDTELQTYLINRHHQIKKRELFSSSRTSSSAAIVHGASGDRTRHSSSATTTLHQQGALSRHSSLLDTQAIAGCSSRTSMTPPAVNPNYHKVTSTGDGGDNRIGGQTGFIVGASEDHDEDEEQIKLRSTTMATDSGDSTTGIDENGVPRLSNSHSLADFMTRVNRRRFDSRCGIGEDGQPSDDLALSPTNAMQQPQQQPITTNVASAIPAEFRRRGSTFSGIITRPCSCPPNASGRASSAMSQVGQRRQGNAFDQSDNLDESADKDWTGGESATKPYEALLYLVNSQVTAQPAIAIRPSPYHLLQEYMTAAQATHSLDRSFLPNEAHDESMENLTNTETSANRKTSSLQRKSSSMQQQSANKENQKDVEIRALKSEIQAMKTELTLVKQRIFYERHQRLLHAERNRRLYGRLKQTTALDEQNQAQRDQLRLQEEEIKELMAAVTELRRQKVCQRNDSAGKEFQLTQRLQTIQRENETLRSSQMATKRTADELLIENRALKKDLGGYVQKLFDKEAAYAQLHERCAHDLPASKNGIAQLNKELFLMGELNRRLRERVKNQKLRQEEFDALRERLRSCEETSKQESGGYRRLARKERHKSDAANQRSQELEIQLQKRQAQIAESKRRLDQASDVHQEQLAACQMKYKALMTLCQRQEEHISELYEKLESNQVRQYEKKKIGQQHHPIMDIDPKKSINEGRSNGENLLDDDIGGTCESGFGVDIPVRIGTASEIRSYDSYHSASFLSQHHLSGLSGAGGGGGGTLSVSVASAGSNDLYLPYLFNNSEFQNGQQEIICQDKETIEPE